jgi:hypothetical protein
VVRRLQLLIFGSLLFWAVIAYPALRLWGTPALAYSAVAVVLCLLPTAGTLVWSHWALESTPEQQLLMVLGGTVVRIATVLGAGVAIYALVDYFHQENFWVWLLVFYLFTLALEMTLIVRGRSAAGQQTSKVDSLAGR